MNTTKDTFALIGKKLSHSFSANFFNEKFQRENIAAEYVNLELPSVEFFLEKIDEIANLKGLNVTIPYKESIVPFLNDCSTEAQEIGAVNTIQFNNKKLFGHNTDWIGFRDSLKPLLKKHHQKALVLGSGGSSKAVIYALDKLGIEHEIVSRKPSKEQLNYNELNEDILQEYSIIINTTPLGMFPDIDSVPDINYELLNSKHLLYDLVYNPEETLFLKKGKFQGSIVKNGLEMLELQALAAWEIWDT